MKSTATKFIPTFAALIVSTFLWIASTGGASAQSYAVSVDTTGLGGSGTWAADFALTDSYDTSVPSSVTLSNFSFGTAGGALGTSPTGGLSGDESGNLSTSIVLSTAGGNYNNEYAEDFTPGSALSFDINLSGLNAPNESPFFPDEFSFDLFNDNPSSPEYGTNVLDSNGDSSLVAAYSPSPGVLDLEASNYLAGSPTPESYSVNVVPLAAAPETTSLFSTGTGIALIAGLGLFGMKRRNTAA